MPSSPMKAKKKNAVASGTLNNPPAAPSAPAPSAPAPTAPAPTAPAPNHSLPAAREQQAPPIRFLDWKLKDSDSSEDWCAEDALESQAGTDSESELEEASEGARSPSNALSEIIDRHYVEDRDYSPIDLRHLLQDAAVVRDIRQEGVDLLKEAIQRSGWLQTSLMIAHDRENDRPPVLLEGAHRAKALVELYTGPLRRLAHPLQRDLKVKVTILRGLSPSEEVQIGRECNKIVSDHVPMSLVDNVVAMSYALETCWKVGNFPPERKTVPMSFLLHLHPDYYGRRRSGKPLAVSSTVRKWKRLAEGLGKEAMEYLRAQHKGSPYVWVNNKKGLVRQAFSTKTLVDSQLINVLQHYPGAQLWYLKRIVALEVEGKLKAHDGDWCFKLAKLLQSVSDMCQDFADFVDRKCPELSWFGRGLSYLVHHGEPKADPEDARSDRAARRYNLFTNFGSRYLWGGGKDKEWEEICGLHAQNDTWYTLGLQNLLADTAFHSSIDDVHRALGWTKEVFFEGAPGPDVQSFTKIADYLQQLTDDELPAKRKRGTTSSSASKKRRQQPPQEEVDEEVEGGEEAEDVQQPQGETEREGQDSLQKEVEHQSQGETQLPQEEEEITPKVSKVRKIKEINFTVRLSYDASNKDQPKKILRIMMEGANSLLQEGEDIQFYSEE